MTLSSDLSKEPLEPLEIHWRLIDGPLFDLWFEMFKKNLVEAQKYMTYRFNGFIHPVKNQDYILDKLFECIDIINFDGRYEIEIERPSEYNQEFANIIHHHFEVLIGSVEEHADIYKQFDQNVAMAVRGLNEYIHDFEAYNRAKIMEKKNKELYFSAIITSVDNPERMLIPQEFEADFNANIAFGDMVIHYNQIGKTWMEVFYDQDEEIFEEAIIPHKYICGDFDVFFGQLYVNQDRWKEMEDFFVSKGKDIKDPSMRLGFLKFGELIRTPLLKNSDIRREIAKYEKVDKIEIYNELGQLEYSVDACLKPFDNF